MPFLRNLLTALFALSLLGGTACSKQIDSVVQAETEVTDETEIAAVLVFAKWCPSCHILDPMVEEVRSAREWDGVSFLRLDYTDKDQAAFFAAAEAAGVGPAVREWYGDRIITGQLLYVDVASQKVLDHAWKSLGKSGITEGLEKALASSTD